MGATSECRLRNGVFAPTGQFGPKFQVPHQPFFMSENQDKRFLQYKNRHNRTSFFCFVTIHAFDRQTERQTDGQKCFRNTVRALHHLHAVATSQGKNAVQSDQTRPDRQKQNRQTWPDRSGPKSLPGLANEKKNIGIESTTAIVYSCCPFYVGNVNFAKIGVI